LGTDSNTPLLRAFQPLLRAFQPRSGATFDENNVPPWTRGDFRGVLDVATKPTPALRDRCHSATAVAPRHPSQGEDFNGVQTKVEVETKIAFATEKILEQRPA